MYSTTQTSTRVIEQANGQIIQTVDKDVGTTLNEISEVKEKTEIFNNRLKNEIDKSAKVDTKRVEVDQCEHCVSDCETDQNINTVITETSEARIDRVGALDNSGNFLEDCSPQKRREKRQRRKKRKSLMEILFV